MYDAIRDFVAILEQNLNRTTSLYIVKECSNVKSNFWYRNVQNVSRVFCWFDLIYLGLAFSSYNWDLRKQKTGENFPS